MKLSIKYMYTKTLLVDTLAVSYKKKNDGSSILYIARRSQTGSCFISFWCRYLQYKSFFFPNIYHSLKKCKRVSHAYKNTHVSEYLIYSNY